MTGKERAALRRMANTIQPIFQIGKGGVGEAMLEQLGMALDARELIKITVLETADVTAREACDILCQALGAEPVQCIGRKVTIYRRNEKEPKIQL
ncbi:MAG: YhbY family RNA-binding protein [Oscillospiraceae bacterium]|jgi:RNA-binding protein|nr:YhbY family RNA-binding protein [Christensenellales bacterium]HIR67971.1 YhbY family RNA-binding protein [Candidatus Pelethousia gallinarum]